MRRYSICGSVQKDKSATKPVRVEGSKDDLFGTGQLKQRRYTTGSSWTCPWVVCSTALMLTIGRMCNAGMMLRDCRFTLQTS